MVVDCWIQHRKQVESICKKHGITINISDIWSSHTKSRIINVPPINCMMHYIVNLHEIGHIVYKRADPANYPNELTTGLFYGANHMPSTLYMELEANKFVARHAICDASEVLEILHEQFISYWEGTKKRRGIKRPKNRFCQALVNKDLKLLKSTFRCLA